MEQGSVKPLPATAVDRRRGAGVMVVSLVALMASGVLTASGALAQSAPTTTGDDITLPAVTVDGSGESATAPVTGYVATRSTAGTKSDTPILETPQSISTVTSDQITRQNVQNLNDALRYTAGVTPETRGTIGTRYDMFKVRGFDADVYWNGLKLIGNGNYILPQFDPAFIDRYEVLKGPSSVLYGQANAGGVVNEVGKAPTDTPQHEVSFEAGTFGHLRSTFDLSGPVDPDGHWLYRVVGVGLDEDSQMTGPENQRIGLMPSVTWRPDGTTSLNLYALYQYDPKAGAYGTIPAVGSVVSGSGGRIATDFYDGDADYEKFNRTQIAVGYQFDKQINNGLTLRMNGRWFHTAQDYQSIYGTGSVSDDGTLTRNVYRSLDNADSFQTDNQLEQKFTTGPIRHQLLGGIDYTVMKTHYWSGGIYDTSVVPSINVYSPQYGVSDIPVADLAKTSQARDQLGLYLQDQISFDKLILTLGGRQDWASSKTLNNGSVSSSDRAFTGRAGLTYVFDNGLAPYLSYSEAFVPQSGFDAISGKPLDPERGRQYEAGIKYAPTGFRALFTAAVFDIKRSNLSTYVSGLGYVQSGAAQSRGFELEGKGEVWPGLNLTASYTYLDTKYLNDDSGLSDHRLMGVPHNSVAVWADYDFTKGSLAPQTLGGLNLGAGLRSFDSSADMSNTLRVKGATLVDAEASFDLGQISPRLTGATVYLNAKNLLNTRYVASCFWGDNTGATNWCAYGDQRTVIAGLRYRW